MTVEPVPGSTGRDGENPLSSSTASPNNNRARLRRGGKLKRLLLRAGWAPAAVVLAHALLAILSGHRVRIDSVFHFLGGASIAYFLDQAVRTFYSWFGNPTHTSRALVVFCMATTIAVFWEFMEFLGGFGMYMQESLPETMSDLLLGSLGALLYVTIATAAGRGKR